MTRVSLKLLPAHYGALMNHLLPEEQDRESEQAAFAFARDEGGAKKRTLSVVEVYLLGPEAFHFQSGYHIELSDDTRAFVIKRAHDLQCSLVEFHCHLGEWPAQFSASDLDGFSEFVPHVWWRLRGRPYAAVVVSESGFDALTWIRDAGTPEPLSALEVGRRRLRPTGLTWERLQSGLPWTA